MTQNKDTTDYEKLLYGAQAAEDPLLEMMKFLLDRILDVTVKPTLLAKDKILS